MVLENAIEGNTLTLMETKVVLERYFSDGEGPTAADQTFIRE